MRKPILITLVLVIALPALLAAVVLYLLHDEAFLKSQIEQRASAALNRSVQIEGPLHLILGQQIRFQAGKISLANADWSERAAMLQVGRLALTLDAGSLLNPPIIVQRLEVDDCQVSAEQNAEGVSNWALSPSTADQVEVTEQQAPRVLVHQLELSNCNIRRQTVARPDASVLQLDKLGLALNPDRQYAGEATGNLNGRNMRVKGTFGPLQSLWQGGQFDHDLLIETGPISLQSAGTVADARHFSGIDIDLRFRGPEITTVTDDFSLPPIGQGPFDLTLNLKTGDAQSGKAPTHIHLDGNLGTFKVAANGRLDRLISPDEGKLELSMTGPDLYAAGMLLGVDGLVREPFNLEVRMRVRENTTHIDTAKLNTQSDSLDISGIIGDRPALDRTDLDLTLQTASLGRWAKMIGQQDLTLGAATAQARVHSGPDNAVLVDGRLTQDANQLDISGLLGKNGNFTEPDVQVKLTTTDLASLGTGVGVNRLPAVPFALEGGVQVQAERIVLSTIEARLEDHHASLNGRIELTPGYVGSELDIKLDVASAASLGELFEIENLPDIPAQLGVNLKPAGQGLEFTIVDGNSSDLELDITGRVDNLAAPTAITANYHLHLPTLRLLAFFAPDQVLPDLPFTARGDVIEVDGKSRLQNGTIQIGQSRFQADATLYLEDHGSGSQARITGGGPDLAELLSPSTAENWAQPFEIELEWQRQDKRDNFEQVHLVVGDMQAHAEGSVTYLTDPAELDLTVSVNGPDASRLRFLLGEDTPETQFALSTQVTGTTADLSVHELTVQLGESSARADLNIALNEVPKVTGTVNAALLDLSPWFPPPPDEPVEKKPDSSSKPVFGDELLYRPGDSGILVDVELNAERVILWGTEYTDVNVGFDLDQNQIGVSPLKLRGPMGATIEAQFSLDGRADKSAWALSFDSQDSRLAMLVRGSVARQQLPSTDIHLQLSGVGNTPAQLASDIDGDIRVFQGPGRIAESGLSWFLSDFTTELFSTLNPFSEDEGYTQLDCSVIAAQVEDGVVDVTTGLIQTAEVTIISEGKIDLGKETINLGFNSQVRKGLGLSASALINPFIKVGGSLKKPAMELDTSGAVLKGGTAVATAGLSILASSLSGRFLASKDPCGDAQRKIEESDNRRY